MAPRPPQRPEQGSLEILRLVNTFSQQVTAQNCQAAILDALELEGRGLTSKQGG